MWLVVIIVLVFFVAYTTIIGSLGSLRLNSLRLEATWTIIPVCILISIAQPSLWLLCHQDVREAPASSLKVISNQWNWQRESNYSWDHLLDSSLLDTVSSFESPAILIAGRRRVVTTRTDVLHSLGVPSLGIKLDTSPGRIRATILDTQTPGLFRGSCYELCGRGHRAIPFNML